MIEFVKKSENFGKSLEFSGNLEKQTLVELKGNLGKIREILGKFRENSGE